MKYHNISETWTTEILSKQFQKYKESYKKLFKIITNGNEMNQYPMYKYHLIDHDWLVKWKDSISFYYLDENITEDDYKKIFYAIEKYIKKINIDNLNNKRIYYADKKVIDPMRTFDLISEDAWKLFDTNNLNAEYNGKVSVKEGYKKIIIIIDENNYSVKYLTSKNIFAEFIIVFKPDENKINKQEVINDVLKKNIYKWMEEIKFEETEKQFTVKKYQAIFDIIQKSNNYLEEAQSLNLSKEIKDASKYISFSKSSFSNFSIDGNSSFIGSSFINSFLKDIGDFRFIQKYDNTSNVCSVMRCLSLIDPFAEYFMSQIKGYKIFSKFQSSNLLNLIGDYFRNLYLNVKTPYAPKDLVSYLKIRNVLNIKEEQDPIEFLNFILNYMSQRLNNLDNGVKSNFSNITNLLKSEPYYPELINIDKESNNIVSNCFYGLILETYNCDKCKINNVQNILKLQMIDLNLIPLYRHFERISDSVVKKSIDDLLDFYFLKNKFCKCGIKPNNNNLKEFQYCPKCNKIIKTPFMNGKCKKCEEDVIISKREIIEYPLYMIVRLNLGEFKEGKGFVNIDEFNYNIDYDKIEQLQMFFSSKNKKYDDINNYEYNLINSIVYSKLGNKIKFHCFCKSPLGPINQNVWISFVCNAKPQEINRGYNNDISKPIILFYNLQKKLNINNNNKI